MISWPALFLGGVETPDTAKGKPRGHHADPRPCENPRSWSLMPDGARDEKWRRDGSGPRGVV